MTIFRLYGGQSADGRGEGVYQGYTSDPVMAKQHWDKVSRNPYSTGGVIAMTHAKEWRMFTSDWEQYGQ